MGVYFGLLFIVSILALVTEFLPQKIYFTSIGRRKIISNKDVSFVMVFALLAFVSAIRDGIGSDYDAYIYHIELIQDGREHYMEIGFQKVVQLLQYIDTNPRLVLIFFSILTCYFYIKSIYQQSSNVFISLFMFLSWGYYFLTFNTVRNYFALSLVLFAIKYLNNEKIMRFIIIICIAALFHKSALICLPIYFIAKKKWPIKQLMISSVALIGICLFARLPIRRLMFLVYPQYEGGIYDTGEISYLNIVKAVVVILLCLIYRKEIYNNDTSRFFFNLNVFSLVFYVGMYWTPEASRIGFYMNVTSIFLIPRVIESIKDRWARIVLTIVLGVFSMALFYLLCRGFTSWSIRLIPYKTWLFDGTY